MEGYSRVVIEIPFSVKAMLNEVVEFKSMTIKLYLITLIHREYLIMKDEQKRAADHKKQ